MQDARDLRDEHNWHESERQQASQRRRLLDRAPPTVTCLRWPLIYQNLVPLRAEHRIIRYPEYNIYV